MSDPWLDRWNERFSRPEFVYGERPNDYLQEQLVNLPVGKILFPAEGEGRNAVYAATLGWHVAAFDISIQGKSKALRLAEKNKVSFDYQVGELQSLNYFPEQFDVIALIYAHFPADIKSSMHKTLCTYLRAGGVIIFEAFSKNHLNYNSNNESVGGPKEIGMLFSVDEIKSDFSEFEIVELHEKVVELNEGPFHSGTGSVIRFVGRKRQLT